MISILTPRRMLEETSKRKKFEPIVVLTDGSEIKLNIPTINELDSTIKQWITDGGFKIIKESDFNGGHPCYLWIPYHSIFKVKAFEPESGF